MDRGAADAAVVAVDASDQALDLVAQDAVLLDLLATGHCDLDEHRVLDVDVALAHQLGEGAQPRVDALGVVEPVDPQEHLARSAQGLADLRRAEAHRVRARHLLEARGVDRDRERGGAHGAPVGEVDEVAVGLVAHPLADQTHEVLRGAGQLEADQVGAQQTLEDLAAPGQLLEQLGRGEGDVQVEADAQVRAQRPQHLRHQLQLVVVHPHGRALGGQRRGLLGEPLVDPDVGVPPLAVELRLGDQVVVERPQGAVGEALVELLDVLGRHRHRRQLHAVALEGLELGVGAAGPADPHAVVGAHHRLDGGHEPAGGGPPALGAVGQLDPVHRQAVGNDHEVVGHATHPSDRRQPLIGVRSLPERLPVSGLPPSGPVVRPRRPAPSSGPVVGPRRRAPSSGPVVRPRRPALSRRRGR